MTTTIGIIIGSTRSTRRALDVGLWVQGLAEAYVAERDTDVAFEIVDLRDHLLPHLGEDREEGAGAAAAQRWTETVARFDGYVVVTPEYNHSLPGVLKNALDHLAGVQANKALGIVSYGGLGGARAAEHLRQVAGELQLADVRQGVQLTLAGDFENFTTLSPNPFTVATLPVMLDQLLAWTSALAVVRADPPRGSAY